jgi:hypothetical protein
MGRKGIGCCRSPKRFKYLVGEEFLNLRKMATRRRKQMKKNGSSDRQISGQASAHRRVAVLEDIPNVGPAIAADLRQLGITTPAQLAWRDPYEMYDDLCRMTGQRHDPCLLDTFIAAVRFMAGEPKKPWWKYTAERKREMAARNARRR